MLINVQGLPATVPLYDGIGTAWRRSAGSPRSTGGAILLGDAAAAFAPVIGLVGGGAAMALANHEWLKQRIGVFGKAPGASGMARRDQPRRV